MQNAFPYLIKKKFHMYLQGWYKMKLEQRLTIFFFVYLLMMESTRKQMTLVVRFVAKNRYVKGCFLDIIYVQDTISFTLSKRFVQHYLTIILTFKMFENKDMMELVICVVS
jgi:hypothetical protein